MAARLIKSSRAWFRLAHLELRRSTGGRALYLAGGCLVWFLMIGLWNALATQNDPMEGSSIQNAILALPTVLLAFFLGSQVISSDQENRSLEVVLALPRGKTVVWILRLFVATAFAGGIALILSVLSWFFVASFPFLAVWLTSLFPIAFFASLAFALSVLFRSGTAAALVCSLILALIIMTQPAWHSGALFYIYPFLNPLLPPDGTLPESWARAFAANRIGVLVTVVSLLVGGLAGMRRRERLL